MQADDQCSADGLSDRVHLMVKSQRNASARTGTDFRRQYDDLELLRVALSQRLSGLGANARDHAGYKRALSLINETFRKCAVAQRRSVLDAADWLIGLLEQIAAQNRPNDKLPFRKIHRVLPPNAKTPSTRPALRRVSAPSHPASHKL